MIFLDTKSETFEKDTKRIADIEKSTEPYVKQNAELIKEVLKTTELNTDQYIDLIKKFPLTITVADTILQQAQEELPMVVSATPPASMPYVFLSILCTGFQQIIDMMVMEVLMKVHAPKEEGDNNGE